MKNDSGFLEEANKTTALIINSTANGELICAASARISTTNGSALEVFEKSTENTNNSNLISKVINSGHKSIIEHFTFNIAFNNVSVFVEQFLIEFRLASFTVQSRRYVDFRNVGFIIPEGLTSEIENKYSDNMNYLFSTYEKLIDLGIPKEDARFVLPYCFKSNFYCSCNARELMHIICTMLYGRGKNNREISSLGNELKNQFDKYFPGVIEKEKRNFLDNDPRYTYEVNARQKNPEVVHPVVELISHTQNAKDIIGEAAKYNFTSNNCSIEIKDIVFSDRARELELLNYTFIIKNISLSAITHLARHRMQTLMVPNVINAVNNNKYIVPGSVVNNAEANKLYLSAFTHNSKIVQELLSDGMQIENLVYFSLSGHTLDVITQMNARELLHYLSLRTCNRAQWEIKDISDMIIKELRKIDEDIFGFFGPSCFIKGYCPEGKMSCGEKDIVVRRYLEMEMTEYER